MAKIEINRITNANIYLDGANLLGRAEEVKLPDVSMTMQEHKALGMVGKVELPAGFDKLEGEIKWNSFYRDAMLSAANPYTATRNTHAGSRRRGGLRCRSFTFRGSAVRTRRRQLRQTGAVCSPDHHQCRSGCAENEG